jgi:hypothetical protein
VGKTPKSGISTFLFLSLKDYASGALALSSSIYLHKENLHTLKLSTNSYLISPLTLCFMPKCLWLSLKTLKLWVKMETRDQNLKVGGGVNSIFSILNE